MLVYDAMSGVFTWSVRPAKYKRAGDVAGGLRADGYERIKILGRNYLAHRLAWLYMTGEWPEHHIDHINGVRSDNSWRNLRNATPVQNSQNQRRAHANNKSGFFGVCKAQGKWQAQIKVDGKSKYLGLFVSPEQANAAYLAAKAIHHEYQTLFIGECK